MYGMDVSILSSRNLVTPYIRFLSSSKVSSYIDLFDILKQIE